MPIVAKQIPNNYARSADGKIKQMRKISRWLSLGSVGLFIGSLSVDAVLSRAAAQVDQITTSGLSYVRVGAPPSFNVAASGCVAVDVPDHLGVSAIVHDGKIKVVAVRATGISTPSGVSVGATEAQLQKAYTGRLEKQSSTYVFKAISALTVSFQINSGKVSVIRAGQREFVLAGCGAASAAGAPGASVNPDTPKASVVAVPTDTAPAELATVPKKKSTGGEAGVVSRYTNAYSQLRDGGNGELQFDDGTSMAVQDGKDWSTFDDLLNHADLADQLSIAYPKGCPVAVPGENEDPGRLRYNPFFAKMYGASSSAVEGHLASVPWFGSTLRVTKINGVDKKLAAIAEELSTHIEWKKYLVKPGGGFNWRLIAKTNRRSEHSYGIAVDINVGLSDYWLNGGGYKNRVPCGIGEVFEKHGFIWGAKWAHYDTMHFEYRPELL
jgi:peptidoglycan LD-endopeptidase CwlK